MQSTDQDQRSLGIEDTSMTIEFLRARLLSERSVSKSARHRADELAERVAELEEQLRTVSLQRKKAEKATADVLAILETHGISDVSDSFYSSSDQEVTPRRHKPRGGDSKKVEGSANSRERESELEKFSSPELESSAAPSRRLPWKGRRDSLHSIEKFKDSSTRRRGSLASVSSSSRQRLGKSCRQIKRREQRSEATSELEDDSSLKADSLNNGGESDTRVENSRVDSGLQKEKMPFEAVISSQLSDEFGAQRDMERALEHQAQLIGQYRDMEKEQREWEKKYQENNSSTAESCDPGNNSDITEEREVVKSQSPFSHQRVTSLPQDPESETKLHSACNSFPETHVPDNFRETSQGDQKANLRVQEEPTSSPLHGHTEQKSMPLVLDGPRKQENAQKNPALGPENSRKQIEPYALVPHQTSDRVGNLLDTLQQAKLLLQKEITRVPPNGFGCEVKAIEPPFRQPGPTGKVDIPGGFSGLFRLPTDISLEATKGNFPFSGSSSGTGSRLSLAGYPHENGVLSTSDVRFASGRYTVSSPTSLPVDDRSFTNQFMNSASRAVIPSPRFDPATPPMFTTYPQYPSGGYFPRPGPDMSSAVPPPDQFLFCSEMSGLRNVASAVPPSHHQFLFHSDMSGPAKMLYR